MRFKIFIYAFFMVGVLWVHPFQGTANQGSGPIFLDPVHFESGETLSRSVDTVKLEKVLALLKSDPSLELIIEGHTDSEGDNDANLSLSLKRARWVADWLIQKGIDGNRLRSRGYGESRPIMGNETAAGRAINRRIEFKVVAQPEVQETAELETAPDKPLMAGKRASAFMPEKVFTFEMVVEGTEVRHVFPIQNQGDGILEIQKVKTG